MIILYKYDNKIKLNPTIISNIQNAIANSETSKKIFSKIGTAFFEDIAFSTKEMAFFNCLL